MDQIAIVYAPHGLHLVAGEWVDSPQRFESDPAEGQPHSFAVGTRYLVDAAAKAASTAFQSYSQTSARQRAAFLRAIADEIEARASAITQIGMQETGLPKARLEGERGRTVHQLRLFADHIQDGACFDRRHDHALPDRQPLPRPDIKMIQQPVGPVAVFGASNFPLAFSVAGGDTASALAAGCPVVVKGHSAHRGTGEIVADAISAAVISTGMPKGVFSLIQGGKRDVGHALVQHPLIKAVGFTGSLSGGRALFNFCAARPDPIPFFGELGSVNPMFLLPNAARTNVESIAEGWASSLTMGAGQFCTNPGIAILPIEQLQTFADTTIKALSKVAPQTMLTSGIASDYHDRVDHVKHGDNVHTHLDETGVGRSVWPTLFSVKATDWIAQPTLSEEIFGPFGLIVTVDSDEQMLDVAQSFVGQLTATMHLTDDDLPLAKSLTPILQQKAGRILVNGFPTGVEVCDAMVHSGPYPASTNFGATSVGTLAIRRFLRPVCFQNMPDALLPADWQQDV